MATGQIYIKANTTLYPAAERGLYWQVGNTEYFAGGTNVFLYEGLGAVFVSGIYLHGQHNDSIARRITGALSSRGADTPGKVYVDSVNTYLYYHDSTGAARYVIPA